MTATASATTPFSVLARREIRHYATAPLFWVGVVLLVAQVVLSSFEENDGTSSTLTMVVPAATLGLLGLITMANLTRRSDRSAAAAGTTAIGESERTLALAAAIVVPVGVALLWYVWAVVYFVAVPPADFAFPAGPVSTGHVLAVMFALSVMAAAGGPLLGLVIARWLRFRGATALATVLVVIVSILLQGNFESTWRWHVVWPWTYWYGPLGWSTTGSGSTNWVALPGSPFVWIGYLAALCVLGLLMALYHDPEGPRTRLRTAILATGAVAVVLLVLTMTNGLAEPWANPVPGPSF